MRFDELDLEYDVLDALDAMHFTECTPIQEQAIGVVLDGHDLIAVAQTGTGKTAAYLLPVINLLAREHDTAPDGIKCVVMVPTHELAQQIDRQMEGFSYFLPISSVAIHGGSDGKDFARQQQGLRRGADVVIATPGRLMAHMKMGYVDFSHVKHFVLDEADRMLDMGFSEDIFQIESKLPKNRQTLLFSATMPDKIQQLSKRILDNPVEVKIAVSRPTEKIDQSAFVCHEGQKTAILKHLFKTAYSQRVIVFASSKLKVKDLSRELRKSGWKSGEMHSDLDQSQREEAMHAFRTGKLDIIVATDILARGIDIDDITMVVNYDVPHEPEDYVHRIGRTARAGAGGKAVTFVSERDRSKFRFIERFLGYEVHKNEVPAELGPAPDYNGPARGDGDRRRGGKRDGGRRDGKKGRGQGGKRHNRPEGNDNTVPAPSVAAEATAASTPVEGQPNAAPQAQGADKPKRKKRRYYHNRKPKS